MGITACKAPPPPRPFSGFTMLSGLLAEFVACQREDSGLSFQSLMVMIEEVSDRRLCFLAALPMACAFRVWISSGLTSWPASSYTLLAFREGSRFWHIEIQSFQDEGRWYYTRKGVFSLLIISCVLLGRLSLTKWEK